MPAILKAISDLNVSPFERAMGRMDKRVNKFVTGDLAAMGRQIGAIFSVYAISRFASSVGKTADEIDNLSNATGATRENIQALQVLFVEAGRGGNEVLQVLGRLRKNLDEATVNVEYARSIQTLGLSFEDVNRLGADKVFERIARALHENAGNAKMGEAAGNLLGRSYAELQGVMTDLAEKGLDPLRELLLATNQIMGEESVKAADKLQLAYDKLGRRMRTNAGNFGITLAGGISGGGGKKPGIGAAVGGGLGALAAILLAAKTGGIGALAAGTLIAGGAAIGGALGGLLKGRQQRATDLFGNQDTFDPEYARRVRERQERSAQQMRDMLNKQRDDALSAADEWFQAASNKVSVSSVRASNRLARMGAYVGGQANPAVAIAERQFKIMELQKTLQEKITKATEGTEELMKEVRDSLEE